MTLEAALTLIADTLGLDAAELIAYAAEDEFGGWNNNEANATFPNGSIWSVEGRTLFALVRALRPAVVVELGVFHGASATHLLAALQANGTGKLTSVDHHSGDSGATEIGGYIPAVQKADFHFVEQRGQQYLATLKDNSVGFIFEDMQHDAEGTAEIWTLAQAKLKPGGVIVSHDAAHPTSGASVRAGIAAADVTDTLVVLIEPGDCGLAIWQKPYALEVVFNDVADTVEVVMKPAPRKPAPKKRTAAKK